MANLDHFRDPDQERTAKEEELRWKSEVGGSRWFTRGWTLQELIAPEHVEFFNHRWNFIGEKKHLIRTLGEITGIDTAVIGSRNALPGFVIARKMSWAVGRQTSRSEDRAYSLLGIFNVNMPLLYGEGDKAFTRFQEHLAQTSTDHSILAWKGQYGYELATPETTMHMDKLFAKSPDDFEIGRKIVRWTPDSANSHHTLTSKGMEFHSNAFIQGEPESYMLLNCRFEDNLQGPLALRLRKPVV